MKKNINFNSALYKPVSIINVINLIFNTQFEKLNAEFILYLSNMKMTRIQTCEIISTLTSYVFCIYLYIKDHLDNRYFEDKSIRHLDMVEDLLMEIELSFYNIRCSKDYENIFEALTTILTILIKLGGARSVLKGNAVSLMAELSVFVKVVRSQHAD